MKREFLGINFVWESLENLQEVDGSTFEFLVQLPILDSIDLFPRDTFGIQIYGFCSLHLNWRMT